jgi:hypothetical protein
MIDSLVLVQVPIQLDAGVGSGGPVGAGDGGLLLPCAALQVARWRRALCHRPAVVLQGARFATPAWCSATGGMRTSTSPLCTAETMHGLHAVPRGVPCNTLHGMCTRDLNDACMLWRGVEHRPPDGQKHLLVHSPGRQGDYNETQGTGVPRYAHYVESQRIMEHVLSRGRIDVADMDCEEQAIDPDYLTQS